MELKLIDFKRLVDFEGKLFELSAEANKMRAVSNALCYNFFDLDGTNPENEGFIIACFETSQLLFRVLTDYIIAVNQKAEKMDKELESIIEQMKIIDPITERREENAL